MMAYATHASRVTSRNFGDEYALSNFLEAQSPSARSCRPRIARGSRPQRGAVSQALLTVGNVACVEVPYGGELRVEVSLCDGLEVGLRGISVERNGFAYGRRYSSSPAISYELIYGSGDRTLPQPLGHGYRGIRSVSFPPQKVTGLIVSVPSRQNYNQINEQLCSIAVDFDSLEQP